MNPLVLAVALITLAGLLLVSAQEAAGGKFGPQWRLLVGGWVAEASPGSGTGACAFRFDLGGHVMVRTNHAELPATGARPGGAHDDLMVIYPGASESQANAVYWDNEGHRIEYNATWSADGNTLTFMSKPGPGPQFRLTYKKLEADSLSVAFEMAAPGQAGAFKPYTSGKIRRLK
jgi:hypothetical protein